MRADEIEDVGLRSVVLHYQYTCRNIRNMPVGDEES